MTKNVNFIDRTNRIRSNWKLYIEILFIFENPLLEKSKLFISDLFINFVSRFYVIFSKSISYVYDSVFKLINLMF
jgi:hypothetical protein